MSASSTVDCDPDITVSSSFGNCSSGAKLSTLSLENNESSTVYVKVEYSIDGGTYQTKTANLSINSSCLLYTSPSPRDRQKSRMPSSA